MSPDKTRNSRRGRGGICTDTREEEECPSALRMTIFLQAALLYLCRLAPCRAHLSLRVFQRCRGCHEQSYYSTVLYCIQAKGGSVSRLEDLHKRMLRRCRTERQFRNSSSLVRDGRNNDFAALQLDSTVLEYTIVMSDLRCRKMSIMQ